jgi:hypothetical protein
VDRIAEGTGPAWLEAFDNKKCKLKHGWFAVKLPAAGDIPWERARQEECEWFESQELWKPIQGEDRNRLGSEQLTKYITRVLSNLVPERYFYHSRNLTWKRELSFLSGFQKFSKTLRIKSMAVMRSLNSYRVMLIRMPLRLFALPSTNFLPISRLTLRESLLHLSLRTSDWFTRSNSYTPL